MKLLLLLVSISAFAQFQTPLIVKPPPAGTSGAAIRLMNRGGFFTGFRADGTMSSNNEYQMPPADGTAGQVLATNGGKLLSWTSVAGNSVPVCSSSDLTDAYTCTLAGLAAYSANYCVIFSVVTANTNAATLNINSIGVKSILRYGGSALVTNDILSSAPVLICYDGTQFVLPPSASPGSGAFLQGGNSFGATAEIGTNDTFGISFKTDGVGRWSIQPSGHLWAGVNDQYNIGAGLTSNSPQTVYAATSMVTPRIGREDAGSLTIMTDFADRWVYGSDGTYYPFITDTLDIGTDLKRVRTVFAKSGEFFIAGGTSAGDFIDTRKVKWRDSLGGTGAWDSQVDVTVSSSQWYLRDNVGDPFEYSVRQSSGSPENYAQFYADLIPARRETALGHTVTDATLPKLGRSGSPWHELWATDGDFAGDLNITGTTVAAAINYSGGYMTGTMRPLFSGTGSIGASGERYGDGYFSAANVLASGFTLSATTTVGYIWTATSTGGAGAWMPAGIDEYDVRNYGAVCNGSTDDTAAIQAAIDAATGISAMIVLPQGNCRVSTLNAAKNFLGMRGQGRTVSRLSTVTNAPVILIEPPALETTKYYLEFRDFSITAGDNGTSQIGIESRGDGFGVSVIKNMYFENLWRGIKIGHTVNVGDINIFESIFSMGGTAYTEAVLVNGTEYVIASVGTTDFTAIGAASNTPGLKFVKSGATGGMGTGISYLAATFNKVGIESTNTSSGSTWSDNFFGGFAMPFNATFGPRAFYIHGYVGDTVMDGNHMEGGWIGFDISCDNGTFATGICSYGENLVITNSKVDGYAYDYRLYNFHNSTILGSRGRGVLDSQISGTLTSGNIFDVVGRADTGSAIERAGWKLTTTYGDLALNAYDEGRIRIGDVTTNLSGTRNGISIKDTASNAIAIGQDSTHYAGLQWTYNATAGLAYATLYTINQTNPMYYAAAGHTFQGGVVNVLNDGTSDTNALAVYNRSIGSRASCLAMYSTDSSSSSVYPAGRLCGKYETASFTDELVSVQTWNGAGYDTAQTWRNSNSTILGNLGLGTSSTAIAPAYQLSFGQTLTNRLLAMYADGTNWFGFGMDSSTLRIETGAFGDAKFYSGGTVKAAIGNSGTVLSTDLTFSVGASFNVGSLAAPPLFSYGYYIQPITALVLDPGTRVDGDVVPISSGMSVGYAGNRWTAGYFNYLYVYNGIQAPSGALGASVTLACPPGQAVKNITVDSGILTSASCGTI